MQSNVAKVNILSDFDRVNLGLVRRIMSVDKTDLSTSTNEIMKQYSKVFEGIGKLNREKTQVCKKEVEYVGHIFSADGIKIYSKRVESIMEMPYPKNKKEVMEW